jgi:amidase
MYRLALVSTILCAAASAQPANLAGEWELTLLRFNGAQRNYTRANLEVRGDQLSGTVGERTAEGTVKGATVQFRLLDKEKKLFATLSGSLANSTLSGDGANADDGQQFHWTAHRPAARPAAPRALQFTPTEFHNYFSPAIPPVMHIFPGDSVETNSVDAGGSDEKSTRRSPGGNPLTGPFYVEGAMPGDTLVVHINRLRLNRDSAESGDSIVGTLLNPYYLRGLKPDEHFSSEWKLDRERGTASLAKPTDRLKNFHVKMVPMLGCIGVAPPAQQVYRSGYLGPWGGNMDYNQFIEGVTIYFPVFQPGALLFLGDGHAAQGDGELTGDALETSTAYTFTVDVVRGKSPQMPRSENAQYRMASGISNSLPEAVQAATTNLAQWLTDDYKLSANEVAVVLGSSIRYDIAELVDPMVHVVAKIDKSLLAQLNQP